MDNSIHVAPLLVIGSRLLEGGTHYRALNVPTNLPRAPLPPLKREPGAQSSTYRNFRGAESAAHGRRYVLAYQPISAPRWFRPRPIPSLLGELRAPPALRDQGSEDLNLSFRQRLSSGAGCFFQKYGYTHLSAGELLRDERKNPDSQYGELIEKYIKEGKIVPVEITISLLKREMDQTMAASAQKNKFLIDGFPRNQDNLQGWNKTMDGKADVSFVLFFDCNNEICIERCLERGKSSGRSDDNRESLEKRIQTYLQSTKPIIDLYEEMGKVKKIDASKSVDEVSVPSLSLKKNVK
ncbi:PREDICTED: UMP-CMP kinase [Rhinopithecus bieti]|uniref:UMP-CMP kinase n=1 Tax=Rhinopithecus bieti TaxID=61621 RepID=UPI00083C5660|nr:PREDICTED: UMP-CMP kinase [Rhinopithecus bieti]